MKQHNELTTLCRNIKRLRLTHHLSTWQMAQVMHIDTNQLHRIETNDFPDELDVSILFYLADYFHCSPASLFRQ